MIPTQSICSVNSGSVVKFTQLVLKRLPVQTHTLKLPSVHSENNVYLIDLRNST